MNLIKLAGMRKIVAILTKKGALCNDLQEDMEINIFGLEEERVVEFESVKLSTTEYKSFMSVLTSKKISLLYMKNINEEFKKILKNAGCFFKSQDDFKNDDFIRRFIFS